jgi:hypothetical protein
MSAATVMSSSEKVTHDKLSFRRVQTALFEAFLPTLKDKIFEAFSILPASRGKVCICFI